MFVGLIELIADELDVDDVDPIYFYKPYYIEPVKGGAAVGVGAGEPSPAAMPRSA